MSNKRIRMDFSDYADAMAHHSPGAPFRCGYVISQTQVCGAPSRTWPEGDGKTEHLGEIPWDPYILCEKCAKGGRANPDHQCERYPQRGRSSWGDCHPLPYIASWGEQKHIWYHRAPEEWDQKNTCKPCWRKHRWMNASADLFTVMMARAYEVGSRKAAEAAARIRADLKFVEAHVLPDACKCDAMDAREWLLRRAFPAPLALIVDNYVGKSCDFVAISTPSAFSNEVVILVLDDNESKLSKWESPAAHPVDPAAFTLPLEGFVSSYGRRPGNLLRPVRAGVPPTISDFELIIRYSCKSPAYLLKYEVPLVLKKRQRLPKPHKNRKRRLRRQRLRTALAL